MSVELSDEELDSLTTALFNRYKVDFTQYQKRTMKKMVGKAMHKMGFTDLMQLWSSLMREKKTFLEFVDNVTVGMTSMFRGVDMWKELRKKILVDIKKKGAIKVMHAGCSTGEEVYSLGIILKEIGLQKNAQADAFDLNRDSIEICKKGVYNNVTLRQNEKQFKEYNPFGRFQRFYKEEPGGKSYQMNLDLIDHVSFKEGNLVHDNFDSNYDIVFCRNVLIYFDSKLKQKIINKFYDALKPGGFMVLGFFDSTNDVDINDFESYSGQLRLFRKPITV